ncbi:MAG: hypothetical protein JSW68_08850 [Burkholderiales bacterium]|nr:MAG: hypothetical protein JSW68_08850 [Burkholderiales bacterium]
MALAAVCLVLAGCEALLPSSQSATERRWKSFDEALASFDSVEVGTTRAAELDALGFNPFSNPNAVVLNHADLLVRFAVVGGNENEFLDPAVRTCLALRQRCRAFELDHRDIRRQRVGSFWLDFLNFRRNTDITGWRFKALLVIQDELVVYKLWSGQPDIRELERVHNPLGPLQGLGEATVRYQFEPR